MARFLWVIEVKSNEGSVWRRDKVYTPFDTKKAASCRIDRIPSFVKRDKVFRIVRYIPEVK